MKKKSWLSVMLAVSLGLSMLAGCAGGGGQTQTGQDTTQAAPESSKEEGGSQEADGAGLFADEDTYTLTIPYVTTGTEPEDLDLIQEKVSEITLREINCDVEFVTVNMSDMATKYNMWFSNGEKMDLIITVFMDYVSMINSDAFMGMDDLIQEYGQDLLAKDKEKGFLKAGTYKGIQYGIPTIPSAPGNGGAIYIRKDIYDALDTSGIDPDGYQDYEDLENLFSQIKEKFPDVTPFGRAGTLSESSYFTVKNYDDLGVSGASCGVLMHPMEDTTVENLFAAEEYREYLDWMRKWYQAGYISSDAATTTESVETLVKAGRAASMIGMNTAGYREGMETSTGREMVQLDLCPNYMTTRVYTGVMFFIPHNSEKPERAMAFLNLLFNDAEVNNLLTHGIEGEHYTLQDNGVIVDYVEDRGYINTVGVWGDQAQAYIAAPATPDMIPQREDYLKVSMDHMSKANGYQFDMTEVSVEQAAVKNVINQYLTQLEYGTVDVDEIYPEFVDALNKAGIEKIIEANQKQLDAWLADNG